MSKRRRWSAGSEAKFNPPIEVINFFKLVSEGRLKEAEDILTKTIHTLPHEEHDGFQGYLRGLEGILLSLKDKGRLTYISRIIASPTLLKKAEKEFSRHVRDELHGSYDRWYFKALLDYARFILSATSS